MVAHEGKLRRDSFFLIPSSQISVCPAGQQSDSWRRSRTQLPALLQGSAAQFQGLCRGLEWSVRVWLPPVQHVTLVPSSWSPAASCWSLRGHCGLQEVQHPCNCITLHLPCISLFFCHVMQISFNLERTRRCLPVGDAKPFHCFHTLLYKILQDTAFRSMVDRLSSEA